MSGEVGLPGRQGPMGRPFSPGNFFLQRVVTEDGVERRLKFKYNEDFVDFLKALVEPVNRRFLEQEKLWIIYTDFYDERILHTASLLFDHVFLVEDDEFKEIGGRG